MKEPPPTKPLDVILKESERRLNFEPLDDDEHAELVLRQAKGIKERARKRAANINDKGRKR